MILEDKEKNDYLQERRQKRGKILTIGFFVIWIVSFISIFIFSHYFMFLYFSILFLYFSILMLIAR